MRRLALLLLLLLLAPAVHAQQIRQQSTNYRIPTDVVSSGGGESAKSTNYVLDDTLGEPNIGFGRSDIFDLNAGYRQTVNNEFLSLSCTPLTVNVGVITFTGQKTGSGSCTVVTDADAGYSLEWQVRTGSGGNFTGHLVSQFEDTIPPFTPAVIGTPETWTIAATASEWGGRLSSRSTDTDPKWGTDGSSDKWLNVGTGSYVVVTRSTRTSVAGSIEIIEYRTEVGAQKIQPTGVYQATITLTASSL